MSAEDRPRAGSHRRVSKSDHYYLVYKSLIRDLEYAAKTYAGNRLLDIGCGDKPYEEMFRGRVTGYVGCDVAQSRLNRVDLLCEATSIPLASESFDTVFSTQAIEHVADHQGLLNEAYRLLKPGGYIIVSGPMYWHLHEEPRDFFRFTKYGFSYILAKSGFAVVEIMSNGGKWATLGQVILHTMPARLVSLKLVRGVNNRIFAFLDDKFHNDVNTINYVVVGRKEV